MEDLYNNSKYWQLILITGLLYNRVFYRVNAMYGIILGAISSLLFMIKDNIRLINGIELSEESLDLL